MRLRTIGLIVILALGLLAGPLPAYAQQVPIPARVGVVHLMHRLEAPVVVGLRQGLGDIGYVEGRDVILEIRAAKGRYPIAVKYAHELRKLNVHLFVSAGTAASKAVKEAAGDLPIVFTQVGNPVGAKFVKSFARPAGNMTGFSHLLPETSGKRLELLRELVPGVQTVLIIFAPTNPTSSVAATVTRRAAKKMSIRLRERHVRTRDDVLAIIREVNRQTVDAMLILPDSLVVNAGRQIIETAQREQIPVIFHEGTWVKRGGLASYGTSFVALGRQAAGYMDKILKGAKPANLPVQQPTRFELVINLKTAKALGITIPNSVLFQADKVIK